MKLGESNKYDCSETSSQSEKGWETVSATLSSAGAFDSDLIILRATHNHETQNTLMHLF